VTQLEGDWGTGVPCRGAHMTRTALWKIPIFTNVVIGKRSLHKKISDSQYERGETVSEEKSRCTGREKLVCSSS